MTRDEEEDNISYHGSGHGDGRVPVSIGGFFYGQKNQVSIQAVRKRDPAGIEDGEQQQSPRADSHQEIREVAEQHSF
jgi:hypothetical protein